MWLVKPLWQCKGVPLNYFSTALLLFIAGFLLLPSAKQVNNLFYALILLPGLIVLALKPAHLKPESPAQWLWLSFLIAAAVPGILFSEAQYVKHVGYILAFVWIITKLLAPECFRSPVFARVFFWFVLLSICVSAIFAWVSGLYVMGERMASLSGRINGPIFRSMLITATFALALPGWLSARRHFELSLALAGSLVCIGFILQSRSGLVGLAALPLLLIAFSRSGSMPGHTRRFHIVAMSAIVALTILFAGWQSGILSGLLMRGDAFRFLIWTWFWDQWQACGFLRGCGIDLPKAIYSVNGVLESSHPHNIFLALGVHLGFIPLSLFCAATLATLWRAYTRQDPWGLYLATALIMLNFDGSLLIGNPDELWLLVLMPAALILGRESSNDDPHRSGRHSWSG